MRSLFFRIFVSFLGATILVNVLLLALALTADPQRIVFAPNEKRLAAVGKEMLEAYRAGGSAALQELERAAERKDELPAMLFRNSEGPLSGREAPPLVRQLAAKTAVTGERQVQRGPHGPPLIGMPLQDGYVLVAVVPPPSPLQMFFNPYGLTLRLGAVFLVTGLISYLLARSLSAPVRMLRNATQQLASGDLSVRVGPAMQNSRDETGELGRDIDRMAERIGDLLASQRRLLRDISHELRSPLARLNVALGLARLKAGAEAQGSFDRMERESERLNDLIGELLTLSLLENDARGIERVPVDLQSLVREVVEDADFEGKAANRSVRVEQDAAVVVAGVYELLRRAIENVVRNAVRFTAEGTGVEVRLSRYEGVSGPAAQISVRDYGPGVPEEALDRIFEPFYRVTDARDRRSGGAGIGLAIAQRAVKIHGGTIRAFNVSGGGMEVVLELPC